MYQTFLNTLYFLIQIEDYSLVRFLPLDRNDEESIGDLLLSIDLALQHDEDQDVKIPKDDEGDDDDEDRMMNFAHGDDDDQG